LDKKVSVFKIILECFYHVTKDKFEKLVEYTPLEIVKLNQRESVPKNKNDHRTKKISKDYDLPTGEFDVLAEMAKFDNNMDAEGAKEESEDGNDHDASDDESESSEEMQVISKKSVQVKGKATGKSNEKPKKAVKPLAKGKPRK
jgi:hypothetical protein